MSSPRFAAYVPFPDTTLTLNTGGAGDQTATLPAGVYAHFGIGAAILDNNTTTSTLSLFESLGLNFNAGDVVALYDTSADTFLSTSATVVSSTSSTVTLDASFTTSRYDRIYLVGDLLGTIEALLAATDTANNSAFVKLRPSSSDATLADAYYTTGSGVLTLDAYTADVLRMGTSESLSTSGTVVSERSVLGSFAPSKTIIDDRPKKMRPGFSHVADDGTFRKLTIAQQVRHILEVRYRGGPRATDWSEIHAWEDLCDLLDAGYKFRLYRDTDTTTAVYARKTNPYGWQEWHVESGAEFEPRDPVGGTYDHWSQTLNLIEAT